MLYVDLNKKNYVIVRKAIKDYSNRIDGVPTVKAGETLIYVSGVFHNKENALKELAKRNGKGLLDEYYGPCELIELVMKNINN